MQENDAVNRELETALRNLSPKTVKVDPIAAAFAAGRRSANRRLYRWQSAAAALLLVNVGLWLVPIHRDAAPTIVQVQPISIPQPALPPTPLSEQSLAVLQQRVLEHGVDALPVMQRTSFKAVGVWDSSWIN
jgi:hypothetical protein